MDFVWQYILVDSAWYKIGIFNEIEYSMRSVKQNFQGDARLFVVGDKPEVSMDFIHIPGYPRYTEHPSKRAGYRQHVDQYYKKLAMVESDEIEDNFALMYDDIFMLKPFDEDELKINWARAEVKVIDSYLRSPGRMGDLSYKEIWRATYEGIKLMRDMQGLPTYDWETHTPRYFNKEKLKWVLSKSDFIGNPRIISAIYDGLYAENTQIITPDIQADLWADNHNVDLDVEFSKRYMNIHDNAIIGKFIEHMENMFGKCN
jgi:hypothetical protein